MQRQLSSWAIFEFYDLETHLLGVGSTFWGCSAWTLCSLNIGSAKSPINSKLHKTISCCQQGMMESIKVVYRRMVINNVSIRLSNTQRTIIDWGLGFTLLHHVLLLKKLLCLCANLSPQIQTTIIVKLTAVVRTNYLLSFITRLRYYDTWVIWSLIHLHCC